MPKKKKEPYFTEADAASLVQGEEHRLLVREGKDGLNEGEREALVAKVAKATSFEQGLKVISDAL